MKKNNKTRKKKVKDDSKKRPRIRRLSQRALKSDGDLSESDWSEKADIDTNSSEGSVEHSMIDTYIIEQMPPDDELFEIPPGTWLDDGL